MRNISACHRNRSARKTIEYYYSLCVLCFRFQARPPLSARAKYDRRSCLATHVVADETWLCRHNARTMRMSLKRFIIATYIMVCSMLTYLNYHYSANSAADMEADYPANSSRRGHDFPQYRENNSELLTAGVVKRKFKRDVPIWPEDKPDSDRLLQQIAYVPDKILPRTLRIYLPHGKLSWDVELGHAMFEKNQCRVSNCELVDDKVKGKNADAVLFRQHVFELAYPRPPHQVWIYYSLESPVNTPSYQHLAGAINWTATYRRDSDIVTPYEKFVTYPKKSADDMTAPQRNYAQGKTKKVAWFVSNCFSVNNRRMYADALNEHIPVDMYGACGPLKCARYSRQCADLLNSDYKFYLSFENSNCRDYISEKFFVNALQSNVIPIVMGARRDDYEAVAPPNSFIHVDDFATPKHLAEHLLYLDQNDTAYNEYFRWKGSGTFVNTKFWCRLCTMLNEPRHKVYANLDQWWRGSDICTVGQWKTGVTVSV